MKLISKILFYLGLRQERRLGRQGADRRGRRANDYCLPEVHDMVEKIDSETREEKRLNIEIAILEEQLSRYNSNCVEVNHGDAE